MGLAGPDPVDDLRPVDALNRLVSNPNAFVDASTNEVLAGQGS